ncbi:GNAT family N-acetyltransferase [Clostridium sp. UBA1056]|uniref:GNAT family N-acetyltransferase n=1 Tax=unclassified Clostridium TaxID=2614128 RepID=UPI0032177A2B
MSDLNLRLMTDSEVTYWYTQEFENHFNSQERKPLADIIKLRNSGHYDLLGLFDEHSNQMLGYATIWKSPNINLLLLDYLGVSSSLRNKGLGSQILLALKKYYKNEYIIAESELPVSEDSPSENNLRERRINFYKRNGFKPVYEMATCGMRWQALILSDDFISSPSEISKIMHNHKAIYGPSRKDVKIPIYQDEVPAMPYWVLRK